MADRPTSWVFSRDQYDRAVSASPTTRATLEALFRAYPLPASRNIGVPSLAMHRAAILLVVLGLAACRSQPTVAAPRRSCIVPWLGTTHLSRLERGAGESALTGVVVDMFTKCPIRDVKLTLTSPAMQGEQTLVADHEGWWGVTNLPPGLCALLAEKDGYKPYTRGGITLRADAVSVAGVELWAPAPPGPTAEDRCEIVALRRRHLPADICLADCLEAAAGDNIAGGCFHVCFAARRYDLYSWKSPPGSDACTPPGR